MAIFTRPMLAESVYNFHIFGDLSLVLSASLFILTGITALLWAIGIVRWLRGNRKTTLTEYSSVTVIVAARNEERDIGRCLEALLAQDYPIGSYSICMVDDHSTDRTLAIANDIAIRNPERLSVLVTPDCPAGIGPKKNALLHAIQQATGSILLFTDADCRVPCSWIRMLVGYYDEQTGAVAGAVMPKPQPGIRATLLWFERLLVNYTSASAIGWGSPASVNGGNLSYRRSAYDQAGGMSHMEIASGDDDLMIQAIARCGWQVKFAAESASRVEDLRIPTPQQHLHAAVRHQSTAEFYPLRWRLAFLATIITAGLYMFCLGLAIFSNALLLAVVSALILRIIIDGIGLSAFAKKLGIRVPAAGFLFCEICLPFYLCIRPLLTFLPEFSWRDRAHRKSPA